MINKINIAIDGPAASGKTTIAKKIAEKIKYNFLDTGLMYRAFTLYCINNNIDLNSLSEKIIKDLLSNFNLEVENNDIILNNKKIDRMDLFSRKIVENINKVTSLFYVRKKMVEIQKKITKSKGYIVVGRDIATVVLPKAELKIFLTADVNERAKRRFKEIENKNDKVTFDVVLKNLINRDNEDENRKISPLKPAYDSIIVDNTKLTFQQTLDKIIKIILKRVNIYE